MDAQKVVETIKIPLPNDGFALVLTIIGNAICGSKGCALCECNIKNPQRQSDLPIHCTGRLDILSPFYPEKSATLMIFPPSFSVSDLNN